MDQWLRQFGRHAAVMSCRPATAPLGRAVQPCQGRGRVSECPGVEAIDGGRASRRRCRPEQAAAWARAESRCSAGGGQCPCRDAEGLLSPSLFPGALASGRAGEEMRRRKAARVFFVGCVLVQHALYRAGGRQSSGDGQAGGGHANTAGNERQQHGQRPSPPSASLVDPGGASAGPAGLPATAVATFSFLVIAPDDAPSDLAYCV